MSVQDYPHLFEPIRLGNTFFRNRIFGAPMGYQNVNGDGYLPESAAYYYERRARGGAASVATMEVIADAQYGRGGDTQMCAETKNVHHNLSRIAYAVSAYGAVPVMEIDHAGMFANRSLSFFGAESAGEAYGPVECECAGRLIKPMDEAFIERMIAKFVDAAALGQRCGYRMALIHAGHGWGLHQFLSPVTNTRTDQWGGSPENRARIVLAIIDGIHRRLGRGFPVEVRISGSECFEGGYGIEEGIRIARQLDGHADLIHVSAGNHEVDEVFGVTHPSIFMEDGCNVPYAAAIKKHVATPVATVGALSDPALMEEILASGQADVVELARELMADPDFPLKVRCGREDETRRCIRCLSCFSNEMSNGEPYCAINPESGREMDAKFAVPAPKEAKKVLVVGGGVGGMQAALTAAERGHQVVLCEREGRLGGVLRCEARVPFKKLVERYLDQQEMLVARDPHIEVRLGTEVDAAYAKGVGADALVVACGADLVVPPIEGIDAPQVLDAVTAYEKAEGLEGRIVVIGGGFVAVELALHLKGLGRDVVVVNNTDHLNDGGNCLHVPGLRREIRLRGLEIRHLVDTYRITEEGIEFRSPDGEGALAADTVVYAVGMRPRWELAASLHDCAPEYYVVGDCVAARTMDAATAEAFMAAQNIGRV